MKLFLNRVEFVSSLPFKGTVTAEGKRKASYFFSLNYTDDAITLKPCAWELFWFTCFWLADWIKLLFNWGDVTEYLLLGRKN